MLATVREIHDQTEREPDHEPHPSLPIEAGDQDAAEHNRQDRRDRNTRGAEAATGVRLGLAHPQHARRHDDERGQRADIHQFEQDVDIDESAGDCRENAEEPCALERRVELLVDLAEELREQAVAAHRIADARLAVQLDEHHRGHADQRAQIDNEGEPVEPGGENHTGDRGIHKLREFRVFDDARHDKRHDDVQHGRDDQRIQDASWQGLVRFDRFLCGRGHCVKADETEEHNRSRRNDAHRLGRTRLEGVPAVRGERFPVRRVDIPHRAHDEQHDDCEFDHHHDVVCAFRLVDADGQHPRDQQHDNESGQVEIGCDPRRGAVCRGQFDRQVDAEAFQELVEIPAPSGGDGRRLECVFKNQIPADHEGDDFAERHIRVRVGGTADWHHRCEFCIAQAGEPATHRGQQEGHAQCRAGGQRSLAGEHEDTGADNRADAEHRQIEGFQRPFERRGLRDHAFDGFLT